MFLFAFTHAHNRSLHWPTASTFCDMLVHVSTMCCIKSLDMCFVQCTHIPASVAKFCSRPGFRVNRTVWRTPIWTDKIPRFLPKEHRATPGLVVSVAASLKANKVSKNEETRKVEYACHFWKCADAVYQKLLKSVHACWKYSLPKLARFLRHSVDVP